LNSFKKTASQQSAKQVFLKRLTGRSFEKTASQQSAKQVFLKRLTGRSFKKTASQQSAKQVFLKTAQGMDAAFGRVGVLRKPRASKARSKFS